MLKKYLPSAVEQEDGLHEGSASPTSMTSSGATSLQDQDGGLPSLSAAGHRATEDCCKELLDTIEELSWHHSQINTS